MDQQAFDSSSEEVPIIVPSQPISNGKTDEQHMLPLMNVENRSFISTYQTATSRKFNTGEKYRFAFHYRVKSSAKIFKYAHGKCFPIISMNRYRCVKVSKLVFGDDLTNYPQNI